MVDNKAPAPALIVARSVDFREGLSSLLAINPGIGPIAQSHDGPSALERISAGCPELVLLDWDLPYEDMMAVMVEIRSHCPQTHCLAFTDHSEKRDEIRSAGADVVLLKGYPAAGLIAAIADLLGRN